MTPSFHGLALDVVVGCRLSVTGLVLVPCPSFGCRVRVVPCRWLSSCIAGHRPFVPGLSSFYHWLSRPCRALSLAVVLYRWPSPFCPWAVVLLSLAVASVSCPVAGCRLVSLAIALLSLGCRPSIIGCRVRVVPCRWLSSCIVGHRPFVPKLSSFYHWLSRPCRALSLAVVLYRWPSPFCPWAVVLLSLAVASVSCPVAGCRLVSLAIALLSLGCRPSIIGCRVCIVPYRWLSSRVFTRRPLFLAVISCCCWLSSSPLGTSTFFHRCHPGVFTLHSPPG